MESCFGSTYASRRLADDGTDHLRVHSSISPGFALPVQAKYVPAVMEFLEV